MELDYPIQDVIWLHKNHVFIILYDRDSNIRKWGQFPNIICLSEKGEKLWTVKLPTTDTGDSYDQVKFEGGKMTEAANVTLIHFRMRHIGLCTATA